MKKLSKSWLRVRSQVFIAKQKKILSPRPFRQPGVQHLDHRDDPKSRIAQELGNGFLLQLRWSFPSPSRQLDMKRDEGIARIAGQKHDRQTLAFVLWNEVFAPDFVPTIGLGPLFEKIVGVNDPRNAGELFWLERKGLP